MRLCILNYYAFYGIIIIGVLYSNDKREILHFEFIVFEKMR